MQWRRRTSPLPSSTSVCLGGSCASGRFSAVRIADDDIASRAARDRCLGDALRAFLSRLAGLIPAPRVNLVTHHGLLAPAASYRERVVPPPEEEPGESCVQHQGYGGFDEGKQAACRRMTRRCPQRESPEPLTAIQGPSSVQAFEAWTGEDMLATSSQVMVSVADEHLEAITD